MFNSGILDVAIGLIFVYLLLSLVCTAINEMIEARLKKRAADLQQGIRELLNDPAGTGLVQDLYNHPLVSSLFQGKYNPAKTSNLPSYIPSRNFALALMDIVLPAKPASPSGATEATVPASASEVTTNPVQPLRDAISSLKNPKAEQALMILVDSAGNDISQVRENIEAWFDSSMDRVSGWYKRRVQWITFFLGLGIALTTNADTITIGTRLSYDLTMRDSLVAAAQEYAKANPASTQPLSPTPNLNEQLEACRKAENSPECKVAKNLKEIQKLGLPIGWDRDDLPPTVEGWLLKFLGWFLTAMAISLGAPFWFDVLNRFMTIRATVKPREKSPEEPSVDKA